MNYFLYHNDWAAARRIISVLLANTDGTPATGEAGQPCKLVKNGAAGDAGASSTNNLVAVDSARGSYELQLTQTEYDLGRLRISYHKAGLLPFVRTYFVEPVPDAWFGTLAAGGASTVTLPIDPVAVNGTRIDPGAIVQLSAGVGDPARGVVSGYVPGTKIVTIDGVWGAVPDNTTQARVLVGPLPPPAQAADVQMIAGVAADAVQLGKMSRGGATGAVVAGTITRTSIPSDLTSGDNDHYAGRTMLFISGALMDQARPIPGHTAAGVFTIDDWAGGGTGFTRAPAVGDTFVIV
jgi:hypothetical protein